jgi:NTE family protein
MNIRHLFKRYPKKIGIAFSGGAAHGAAHVGVIQVLEQYGVFPTIIAGSSAGAIVGAAYAAGASAAEMSTLMYKLKWPRLIRVMPVSTLGVFDTQPMEEFIKREIGDYTFEQLPRKFACVACDLMSGKRVVFNSGLVAPAVRASAAIPSLFSPVRTGGSFLIDGGVVDNLPVDLVKDMGADYIIGVDLSNSVRLNREPHNLFEVLMATATLVQNRASMPAGERMDCWIRPKVDDLSAWTFSNVNVRKLEQRGRSAALKVLSQLQEDLGLPASRRDQR